MEEEEEEGAKSKRIKKSRSYKAIWTNDETKHIKELHVFAKRLVIRFKKNRLCCLQLQNRIKTKVAFQFSFWYDIERENANIQVQYHFHFDEMWTIMSLVMSVSVFTLLLACSLQLTTCSNGVPSSFDEWSNHLNDDLRSIYHQAAEFAWELRYLF